MKGSLYVALDYFKNEPNYRFYNISGDSKYSLYLNICFFDNLIDFLYFDGNLKKELCKAIEDDKSSLNDCLKKLLNYYNFNKSSNNLIETIDTVYIYGNIDEIVEFINNNPILEDKKVVIDNFFSFRNDDLYLLLSELSDYSNIYINLKGNSNAVNIEDIIKTVDIIDNMTNLVKRFDFSQIEQIMYVYDLVRDRIYVKEKSGESRNNSRDLTSVLLGDKIVCLGFSNIFDAIMQKLNIKSRIYILNPTENGKFKHARNVVYVNDDKYNINGIFFFDTTWDCKKDDNKFLESYQYFAVNKLNIDCMNEFNNLKDEEFFNFNMYRADEIVQLIIHGRYNEIPNNYFKAVNNLSKFIDDGLVILSNVNNNYYENRLNNDEEYVNYISEKIYYYADLLDQELNYKQLSDILYNVRKIQYYENPSKYAFDIKLIEENAYNYEIESDEFNSYLESKNFKKNIEVIKLAKTLRKVYEKKVNLNKK